MNELGGARGSSGREILSLDEANAESSSDGVQRHAGAGGATADNENIQRTGGTRADERRPLDLSRRHGSKWIVDLLSDSGEMRSPVANGYRRRDEDGAAVCDGHGGSDGGAKSPEASHEKE